MRKLIAALGLILLGTSPVLADPFSDQYTGMVTRIPALTPPYHANDYLSVVRNGIPYKVPVTAVAGASPITCPVITNYGGVADNATDNSAAFAATLAASGNHCVSFPPGQFYFASAQAVDVLADESVTIMGVGQEVSLLRFPSGINGMNITLNTRTATFHVRGLSFLAGGPPSASASGINLVQAVPEIGSVAMQSDIVDTTFRGSDGYAATNAWQNGVAILDVTNINFINDGFFGTLSGYNGTETIGTGIFAVGYPANTTQVAAQFNVIGSTFEFLNIGIGYDFNVQGFAIANSSFVLNNIGVFSSTTALQKAALQFIGNNCNNYTACVQDATIGGIPFAVYSGNIVFLQTNSVGFEFVGNNTIVSDNTIWMGSGANPNAIGVHVSAGSGVTPTIIHDNIIGGAPGSTMGVGIKLDGFSQSVRVAGNMIDATTVTAPIVNHSAFGNRNFITGQPPNGTAQVITNAVSNEVTNATAPVTAASPSIVSWTAHGLMPGTSFKFNGVGTLTGITAGPTYYVSGGSTYLPNSFSYSATFGGANVNTGGASDTVSISTTPALTRLEVGSTAGFVTGDQVSINGIVGVPCNFITPVWVVDATHLDLSTCLFAGAYTSGGTVSTLP